MARASEFVKSATTETPVSTSKKALEDLLRRYGATGFTVSHDYASRTVVVAFLIARSFQVKTEPVEIRLPISYGEVRRRLEAGDPSFARRGDDWKDAQAERVAWRQIVLFADAALAAARLGLQSVEDVFFAHVMIDAPGGQQLRASDVVFEYRKQLRGTR